MGWNYIPWAYFFLLFLWQVYHQRFWVLWFIGKRWWSCSIQEFSNSRRFASSFSHLVQEWKASQTINSELNKTKEVKNLRIHVERGINQIRLFRILKEDIPVTMIQHVNGKILTCAALCNLKPKLAKPKEKSSKKLLGTLHYKLAD